MNLISLSQIKQTLHAELQKIRDKLFELERAAPNRRSVALASNRIRLALFLKQSSTGKKSFKMLKPRQLIFMTIPFW